jgi:sugar phosphate isomerase/epimerase
MNDSLNTMQNPSRRDFLKTAAGLAVATGALGFGACGLAAESRRWPVACRDAHLRATSQPDSWAAMKELGADGAEVEVNEELGCFSLFHPTKKYTLASADAIETLKADLAENGLAITAFCMHNRLDERLDKELAWARKLVDAALQLGVKAIRIDVVPRAVKREEFLPFAVKACKELCQLVEGGPVRYGIENHGNTTNDPDFLEKLFDGAGSAHLGLTLDVANFYWYGHPLEELYRLYEKFAPRVVHTHCKSIRYPDDKKNVRRQMGWEYGKYCCPVYEGDVDFKRVAGILRKANYAGDLCLEDESLDKFPKDQRAGVLKKEIAFLKRQA